MGEERGPPGFTTEAEIRAELSSGRWISGWKAIAAELGVTERQAQRYAGIGALDKRRAPLARPPRGGWLEVFEGPVIDGQKVYVCVATLRAWQLRHSGLTRIGLAS